MKSVRLHARDLEVLELLADRRVETLDVLHDRLWPTCNRKSAYNRLGALARAGYLEHVIRPDASSSAAATSRPASQHLYLLGPKAPTALRIRDRDTSGLGRKSLNAALIDHQLATNRVADWIGTRLLPESEVPHSGDKRTRPDGAYRTVADDQGRDLVMVEVDLGHYSRARMLTKIVGFLERHDSRAMVIATPTDTRADLVASWLRHGYGDSVMKRVEVFSFGELKRGVVAPTLSPLPPDPTDVDTDAMNDVLGRPGCL